MSGSCRVNALALSVLLGPCLGAGVNDFTINLKVQSGGREQTAISGQLAAPPVFSAKAKEVVWVQWSFANGAAGTPLSVTASAFVVGTLICAVVFGGIETVMFTVLLA